MISRAARGEKPDTPNGSMLKVFCARSMHVAVKTLADAFAEATSTAADIVFEPMGALQARLAAGETADVLILATLAIDTLGKSGAIDTASRADVGRAPIGVAIRDGAPVPDIATPEAFKAALMATPRVALSDPAVGGSAGIYLRDLFARLGLADVIAEKTVRQASGVAAAGVRILGPLPPPFGHATGYAAAVSAGTPDRETARAFIAALTAPASREVWAKAGFEVW